MNVGRRTFALILEWDLRAALGLTVLAFATSCHASPRAISAEDPSSPLTVEGKIPLPHVTGRIDHLSVDLPHRLLFVAEYANGTVDVVDLAAGKVAGRISGLHQPQGVAVLPDDQLVVASGDGTVRFYGGLGRRELARLSLGADADNVQVDARNGHVVVGYGSGGLAVIDPASHRAISFVALSGHPEGFALLGGKAAINIPDSGAVVVADIDTARVEAVWATGLRRSNYPLLITPDGKSVALVYRLPAALQVRDLGTGQVILTRSTCDDADGLFVDGERFLVVCGSGDVDVGSVQGSDSVRIATTPGARTGLFVPELHTLFVAAPARGGSAAIWVLKSRD